MYDRDLAVSLRGHIPHQLSHPLHVVGHDGNAVIEDVVDGHHRQIRLYKLRYHGVQEICRSDYHPVYPAVLAVLEVACLAAADIPVDKGDIIAVLFCLAADTVKHSGEELMRQAAVHGVDEQDADVVAAVCLESAGSGVCHVAQLVRQVKDALTCFIADVRLTVERFADRGRRDTAAPCDVLHGNHGNQLLYLIVFVALMYPISSKIASTFLQKIRFFRILVALSQFNASVFVQYHKSTNQAETVAFHQGGIFAFFYRKMVIFQKSSCFFC